MLKRTTFVICLTLGLFAVGASGIVTATVTTTAPSAPQDVHALSGPTFFQVRVSWTPPASDGGAQITHYVIHAGDDDGDLQPVATVGATEHAWVDERTPPVPPTRHYAVAAVNSVGEGPASDAVCGVFAPFHAVAGVLCSLG